MSTLLTLNLYKAFKWWWSSSTREPTFYMSSPETRSSDDRGGPQILVPLGGSRTPQLDKFQHPEFDKGSNRLLIRTSVCSDS